MQLSPIIYIFAKSKRSKFTFRDTKRHKPARRDLVKLAFRSLAARKLAALVGTEGRTEKTRDPGLSPPCFFSPPTLPRSPQMKMKNGRPKKDTEQVKDIVKHIRYSAEEWEKVQGKLESSGLSYSDFIRKATFRVTITPVNMEAIRELRDTRTELSRIGNNINAIARNGAMVTDPASLDFFLQDLRKCRDIAKELSAELDKIRRTIQ